MKRAGIIAIAGQPNVGKSTILNGILKEKVAITSKRPETTRDLIRGILTEDECQMIFIDTPGIHRPHDLLGKVMLSRAQSSLMEADMVLFVTEKKLIFTAEDENIIKRLPDPKKGAKVILVINKTDKIREKRILLPLIKKAGALYPFEEIVPLCALKPKDLAGLLKTIRGHLPEGPYLYPDDQLTDRSDMFHISEIIREKVLILTYEEIPHSSAVVIDEMKEDDKGKVVIHACIFVERTSQKSILIGKNGAMIKKIGELARGEIQQYLGKRVYLDLWIKVYEKWKKDPTGLREMGYSD